MDSGSGCAATVFIALTTEQLEREDEKMIEGISDWGIRCRTCDEPVILGSKLDPRYADFFSFLQPGSFSCVHGHTHNYDSNDVFFASSSDTPATEAQKAKNRALYELLSPSELAKST
jgi:hypothetical protein